MSTGRVVGLERNEVYAPATSHEQFNNQHDWLGLRYYHGWARVVKYKAISEEGGTWLEVGVSEPGGLFVVKSGTVVEYYGSSADAVIEAQPAACHGPAAMGWKYHCPSYNLGRCSYNSTRSRLNKSNWRCNIVDHRWRTHIPSRLLLPKYLCLCRRSAMQCR